MSDGWIDRSLDCIRLDSKGYYLICLGVDSVSRVTDCFISKFMTVSRSQLRYKSAICEQTLRAKLWMRRRRCPPGEVNSRATYSHNKFVFVIRWKKNKRKTDPKRGKKNLNVNAVLVRQLVVVLDLDRHGLVGVDAGRLHIRRVRHEKVAVEIHRTDARRRPNAHYRIKGHRLFNVAAHVLNQPLSVQVRLLFPNSNLIETSKHLERFKTNLEISVLVDLAASEPGALADRGQIDKGVVGHKEVDAATESGAVLAQLVVVRRLRRQHRLLLLRAQQFTLVAALQTAGSFGDRQRRVEYQQLAGALGRLQRFQSGFNRRTQNRFRLSRIGKHGRDLGHQLVDDVLRLERIAEETVQQRHKHVLL